MEKLGSSCYATIVHQMKLMPTKEDAPIKLRPSVAPPLAVGLTTVEAAVPVDAEDAAVVLPAVAAPAAAADLAQADASVVTPHRLARSSPCSGATPNACSAALFMRMEHMHAVSLAAASLSGPQHDAGGAVVVLR